MIRINKEKQRRIVPTIIFMLLFAALFYLGISGASVQPEIVISVTAGCVTIYLGLNRHWIEADKMFQELFREFNNRFDGMNEDLNSICNNDNRLDSKKVREVIQDYLNLCSEEYLWYKRGRIDKNVWNAWKKGVEYYLKCRVIKEYFEKEQKESVSYYGLFDEILDVSKKQN